MARERGFPLPFGERIKARGQASGWRIGEYQKSILLLDAA